MLRHVVMFGWKPEVPADTIREIEDTFRALPAKIPQVAAFEWGIDISVQGFSRGFTHCFVISFASEADRDAYQAHPDHQAFLALGRPNVAQLLTFDYFATA